MRTVKCFWVFLMLVVLTGCGKKIEGILGVKLGADISSVKIVEKVNDVELHCPGMSVVEGAIYSIVPPVPLPQRKARQFIPVEYAENRYYCSTLLSGKIVRVWAEVEMFGLSCWGEANQMFCDYSYDLREKYGDFQYLDGDCDHKTPKLQVERSGFISNGDRIIKVEHLHLHENGNSVRGGRAIVVICAEDRELLNSDQTAEAL